MLPVPPLLFCGRAHAARQLWGARVALSRRHCLSTSTTTTACATAYSGTTSSTRPASAARTGSTRCTSTSAGHHYAHSLAVHPSTRVVAEGPTKGMAHVIGDTSAPLLSLTVDGKQLHAWLRGCMPACRRAGVPACLRPACLRATVADRSTPNRVSGVFNKATATHPDGPALIAYEQGVRFTYAELEHNVAAVSNQ